MLVNLKNDTMYLRVNAVTEKLTNDLQLHATDQ